MLGEIVLKVLAALAVPIWEAAQKAKTAEQFRKALRGPLKLQILKETRDRAVESLR